MPPTKYWKVTTYIYALHNKSLWEAATGRRSGWSSGGVNTKGRQNIKEDGGRLQEGAEFWFSQTEWRLWFKHWREFMKKSVLEKNSLHPGVPTHKAKAPTAPAGVSRNSCSAFISSPIGRTNKIVQFKKRPLISCSLKAAYTQKKTR